MTSIALDQHHGFVYEGDAGLGRVVSPSPVITAARIVFESEEIIAAERTDNAYGLRFREDFFDPVSRIRRGRFYFADKGPRDWVIPEHPTIPRMGTNISGSTRKSLYTFDRYSIWHQYLNGKDEQPLVLLGVDKRFTVWKIIDVEVVSTGEELVTLKARSSLGVLPRLDISKIPEGFRSRVKQSLDTFRDEVYRSSPVSVIDRARDATSQILLAYFSDQEDVPKELGELIKKFESEEKVVVQSAAKIIARFHARAKPVEQQKREMRTIREQDAELATQCLGV